VRLASDKRERGPEWGLQTHNRVLSVDASCVIRAASSRLSDAEPSRRRYRAGRARARRSRVSISPFLRLGGRRRRCCARRAARSPVFRPHADGPIRSRCCRGDQPPAVRFALRTSIRNRLIERFRYAGRCFGVVSIRRASAIRRRPRRPAFADRLRAASPSTSSARALGIDLAGSRSLRTTK